MPERRQDLSNGAEWLMRYDVESSDGPGFQVFFRRALEGPLAEAYPAGVHDFEIRVGRLQHADGVHRACQSAFEDYPDCRRITFAANTADLDSVAFAEESGFRYVRDVEVREPTGSAPVGLSTNLSLLVLEPQWILDQPIAVDDLPL